MNLDFPYHKDSHQQNPQPKRNESYLCMWTEIVDNSKQQFFKGVGIDATEFVRSKLEEFKDMASLLADEIDDANRTALTVSYTHLTLPTNREV